MAFAAAIFFLSLAGIIGLFCAKYWEQEHGSIPYPNIREKADEQAAKLKSLVSLGRTELSKLPPHAFFMARRAVHAGALTIARLAREIESQAHRLADMVSHKHHFEKKETRSEFLKQVAEHPISNNNGSNSQHGASSGNDGTRQL